MSRLLLCMAGGALGAVTSGHYDLTWGEVVLWAAWLIWLAGVFALCGRGES